MTAVASYLGLSQTELQDQMQSGKSLADAAQAQGKSVSGLEDAMVAAFKTNLDAANTLTPDQRAAAVAEMKSRIDTMMNTAHSPGEGMGAAFGAGMGMHTGTGTGTGTRTGSGMETTRR
ncbi:hypothetical protein [Cryobacterium sp. TMT2-23]|uniref:hypothetical protein n=1 Tax=Cryobacterium sp. TMT2-23 TaxID=1259252 RepID=UPI00106A0870|nr:hypothetical protein [Cryobacterium sp. TMT2-23]TFD22002.1 hypothetical protein E3T32_07110 [Cryobacterium sp. TMT2-23]